MLINPKRHKIIYVLRFGFKASNNKAEYEALLAGLRLAKELKVGHIQIFSDSRNLLSSKSQKSTKLEVKRW